MEEPVMQRVKSSTGTSSRIDLTFWLHEVESVTIMPLLVEISKLESGVDPVIGQSMEEPVIQRVKSSTAASSRTGFIFLLHDVDSASIMPSLVAIAKIESGAELVMEESVQEPVMR